MINNPTSLEHQQRILRRGSSIGDIYRKTIIDMNNLDNRKSKMEG